MSADGLTCVGFADRASVQSTASLVPSRFAFFSPSSYFEAKVIVSRGRVAIGVAAHETRDNVGWLQRPDSLALGDTGNRLQRLVADAFRGAACDAPDLAELCKGDVVGCGLRWVDPGRKKVDIFFTRNGRRVATGKNSESAGGDGGCGLADIFNDAASNGDTLPNVLPSVQLCEGESVIFNLQGPFSYAPAQSAASGMPERSASDTAAAGAVLHLLPP